jgi:glyoxylase-like metal-dependent hydrolase (beta-lactamase superfamily II)
MRVRSDDHHLSFDVMASTGLAEWTIGSVVITKLVELEFSGVVTSAVSENLDCATIEQVLAIPWLKPTWMNEANEVSASVHSFLIETPERRLIVDTGIGNGKHRASAGFNGLQTDYLQRLMQAGRPPDRVDGVICTHLHVDHVGWNTVFEDGQWVPTFGNAEYYFVDSEFDHWKRYADDPDGPLAYRTQWARDMVDGAAVFNDSVRPIADAGLARLVAPDASITPEVRLLASPGHTPGHVCVVIESEGQSAVITGDMMHSIYQIAHPEWSSVLDTDLDEARRTRQHQVAEWADSGTLVLGTHFGPPTGGHIVRDDDSFRLV